jgi:TRAP-type C4-dicarboxylate transport system substrate-binding protein
MQPFVHQVADRLDAELLDKLRDDGLQVNDIDRPAFSSASRPVYAEFAAEVEGGDELLGTVLEVGAN